MPFACFFNCDYKARLAGVSEEEFLFGSTCTRIRSMEATLHRHNEDWIMCEPGISKRWEKNHRFVLTERPSVLHIELNRKEEISRDLTLHSEEWGSEFVPGGAFGYSFSELELPRSQIRSARDARRGIRVLTAKELIEEGYLEPQRYFAERYGKEKFICAWGGNVLFNALYFFGGLEEGLIATKLRSELFREVVQINLEQEMEFARASAQLGADGMWIAEMLASPDVLSPEFYRTVILPAERQLALECRELGLKSYFYLTGDAVSMVEMIRELPTDGLVVEPYDQRGHRLDIAQLRRELPDICLFGNVDPIGILLKGAKDEIESEVRRQIEVAGRDGRFVMHSNVIPGTVAPQRIDWFYEATLKFGAY